ncbi:MAG: S41 family peptidase [Sphingobacteriaceae bacterium]|nr:S41 family peptidase [Sphingobacteriaceae bacterium]
MRKVKYSVITLALVVSALTLAFKEELFLISKNLDIFVALYKEVNINYVEETNPTTLMSDAIDAMLDRLDPYTDFVPESEIENYRLQYVSTQYSGIGVATLFIDNKLFVDELIEGFPAAKNDVKPGDQILKINNVDIHGKDNEQVTQLMRGVKGGKVSLLLKRDGASILKEIPREEIKQSNVSYFGMLEGEIGYIRLDKFLENCASEVENALVTLNKSNPKGIILDLRNNGGGILQEAVKIVNLFTANNTTIVVQKARNDAKTYAHATTKEPISLHLPLVVLINKNSASASEIVAGAFQDLDRAVVLGQRSFGKGLVQQMFNLPYNTMVKVTIAKYYIPSGRCIQEIDYGRKKDDLNNAKYSDDLLAVPYKTKIGRIVYGGKGICPDIMMPVQKMSLIAKKLTEERLFFDFANQYYKTHKQISKPEVFKLSDTDYHNFVASLPDKKYNYTAETEKILNELKLTAENENSIDEVKSDIEALKSKINNLKKTDFVKFKPEIKQILEKHIVSRYYFEKGKVLQSFQYDKEVDEAKEIINNPAKTNAILRGDGIYKTIGALK